MRRYRPILCVLIGIALSSPASALEFWSLNVSVGVDLTQSEPLLASGNSALGQSFDSAQLVLGGALNLGRMFIDHLDFVPGFDALI